MEHLRLEQLLALRFGFSRVASSLTVVEHGVERQTASGYIVGQVIGNQLRWEINGSFAWSQELQRLPTSKILRLFLARSLTFLFSIIDSIMIKVSKQRFL